MTIDSGDSAKLFQCVDCGTMVSSRAERCPKCYSVRTLCRVCSEPIRRGEGINVSGNRPFHKKCISPVFQFSGNICCPDCRKELNNLLTFDQLVQGMKSCPFCGAPEPLGPTRQCAHCFLPVYSFLDSFHARNERTGTDEIVHRFCRPDQGRKNIEIVEGIKQAKGMVLLAMLLGVIGLGGATFPVLIPLSPVALVLSIKAYNDLEKLNSNKGHGGAGCAIALAALGTLAVAGTLLMMIMGGK